MSELVMLELISETLGPEFAQLHLLHPPAYAVCMHGWLWKLHDGGGMLIKRTKHYYALAGHLLYEFSPIVDGDAGPGGGNSGGSSGGSSSGGGGGGGGGSGAAAAGPSYCLTMVLPLVGLAVLQGRFEGHAHALRIIRSDGRNGNAELPLAVGKPGGVLRPARRPEVIFLAERADDQRAWQQWLERCTMDSHAAPTRPERRGDDGGGGGRSAGGGGWGDGGEEGYRHLYVTCEGVEEDEGVALYQWLMTALSERM
ncbi:unnamed protein product [Phaeothamnion confervicola]